MVLHLITERPTDGEGEGEEKGEEGTGERGRNRASGYLLRPLSPSYYTVGHRILWPLRSLNVNQHTVAVVPFHEEGKGVTHA